MNKRYRKVNFCVLTSQRTGSTWLIDMLSHTEELSVYSEVFLDKPRVENDFNRHILPDLRFYEFKMLGNRRRPFSVFNYLNILSDSAPGTTGFKLMYDQLKQFPEILIKFVFGGYRIIHLTRDNLLDIIISEELMRQKGRQHSYKETKIEHVALDPESLLTRLDHKSKQKNSYRKLLRLLPISVLEVSYEKLVSDTEEQLGNIYSHLGLSKDTRPSASSAFKRINKGTNQERIANYDLVAELLSATKYKWML